LGVTLDLAEGVGRDYSVINVFRLAPIPQADMEKVTSPGSVMESKFFQSKNKKLIAKDVYDDAYTHK
jgi:hypothetical protein